MKLDWWFVFVPLRSLVTQANLPSPILTVGFAYLLIAAWALASLAYQRAKDAGINEWIAAAAIAPFLQLGVIAYLSVVPSRGTDPLPSAGVKSGGPHSQGANIAYGIIACVGVTVAAVALSTLLFSSYGFGLFVFSPFIIGAITAFIFNFKTDLGARRTNILLAVATGSAQSASSRSRSKASSASS